MLCNVDILSSFCACKRWYRLWTSFSELDTLTKGENILNRMVVKLGQIFSTCKVIKWDPIGGLMTVVPFELCTGPVGNPDPHVFEVTIYAMWRAG